MNKLIATVILSFFTTLLVACGGGGGGAEALITYVGQYIDAPVKGLKYVASPSGLSGTTDADGRFNFRAGDTILFSIQSVNGSIRAGQYTPVTPVSPNVVSHAIVTDMTGGIQIAQTLQSIGAVAANSIDVSNVSISLPQILELNTFIASSGTSQQPQVISVGPAQALETVINYISGNVVNTSPPIAIADLLSSSTLYYASSNNESGFFRMNSDRTWINNFNAIGGTWSPIDIKTYQTLSTARRGGCASTVAGTEVCQGMSVVVKNTITLPSVNLQGGTFYAVREVQTDAPIATASPPAQIIQPSNWSGIFKKVKTDGNSFSVANLAGRTLTITYGGPGVSNSCSDGVINYSFAANDMRYRKSCNSGAEMVSPFLTAGMVSDSVPGVIKLTETGLPTPYYMGVVSGSLGRGELAVTVQNSMPTFLSFSTR